jgi:geranylgeranyl reductase family protein
MRSADAVVVGGGPAGTSAAVTLARAGREVTLIDKASFPRDKCCGDGLTTSALRSLDTLGLDPASVPSWKDVADFSIRSVSGRWVHLPLPTDGLYAAVARRVELDAALLDLARSAGVKVLDGHGCTGARQDDDGVVLTVDGVGEVGAPWLVAADGAWSPTRKMLGASHPAGYRGDWHAFRQYFGSVTGRAAHDLVVWFEPDIVPGYLWSFPVAGGAANVGFGIERGGRAEVGDMASLWTDLLSRPHVREALGEHATPEGPHRAWPIPARIEAVTLSLGRALWVGDAAAACDPMTGEGIGQALDTGRWAAEAVLAGGEHQTDAVHHQYETQVHRTLVNDHRMSRLLLLALRHRKGNRFPLWLVDRNDWTRRNFARWLWEDYPRALIGTPRRWHRGMFTGPGAYRSAT